MRKCVFFWLWTAETHLNQLEQKGENPLVQVEVPEYGKNGLNPGLEPRHMNLTPRSYF
jgi:hypothetical protein